MKSPQRGVRKTPAPVWLLSLLLVGACLGACSDEGSKSPTDGAVDQGIDGATPADGAAPADAPPADGPRVDGSTPRQDGSLPTPDGQLPADGGSDSSVVTPPPVSVPDYETLCQNRNHANCYYVSNSNNYPAGTTAAMQLTMAQVSSRSFSPGDVIMFARGDTWRQTQNARLLTVSSSGTSAAWIQYGAYGQGPKPRFLGSIAATSWSTTTGNVWRSATAIAQNPHSIDSGAELFFEKKDGSAIFGRYVSSASGLSREGDWTFSGNRVSVYAAQSPGTLYASVEVPQARQLIYLNDKQYVAFDSLVLRYMVNAGYYEHYGNNLKLKGLKVTNGEIGYIGVKNSTSAYGLSLDRSEITIAGNEIHDCGRRGVSLVLYYTASSVIRDVVIEGNHFHSGYHTTGVDIQSNNPKTGTGHIIEKIHIRGNLFASDPSYDIDAPDEARSNLVFTKQHTNSTLRDIYIYNNVFAYAPGSGVKTEGGEDYHIYNNTFYGFNPHHTGYQAHIFGGSSARNTSIINNIFVNDASHNRYAHIEYLNGRQSHYTVDRNLYYSLNGGSARLLWVDKGKSHFFSGWGAYKSATGFDANSPSPADPQFLAAPTDLKIKATSPAVGKGTAMTWLKTDYLGVPRTNPPDVGAFQH